MGRKKQLTVGLLAEKKNKWERRAPLTPQAVEWLIERGISVEVLASPLRFYKDTHYRKAGARVLKSFKNATLLIGIKEPDPKDLILKKVYCFFSHTTKGQQHNRALLRSALKNHVTLVDYEHIRSKRGERLVYFGRFAGICGMIDSLHYLGKRWEVLGFKTPLLQVKRSLDYLTFDKARKHLVQVVRALQRKGFPSPVSPFIVAITGHGNVAKGAQEVLDLFRPIEIHPNDIFKFVKQQKQRKKKIYKIVFTREEKLRSKNREGFYFEEYLEHPEKFESNLDRYLPYLDLLIHASYWSSRYPRLVTEAMISRLYRQKKPHIQLTFIGDLSCDVRGAVELTQKSTTPDNPVFTYNPKTKKIQDGFKGKGVTILAVDNLPCEMPKDSSDEFSSMIRDYVYQIASHGATDITNHHALPIEIRNAVICQGGRLTKSFSYLRKYL